MKLKNILIVLFFLFSIFSFGQESKYPKDTIYVKFENKKGIINWNAKFERTYEKMNGIFFNIENEKGNMALFYDIKKKSDTLCTSHLKNYKFVNLKEIRKKHNEWINKLHNGQRKPPANKNGAFHTFLIEIISKEKFVIYPVIWRSEGVID